MLLLPFRRTNQERAGYENTVVYRCRKGIHVKNTAHRGPMNIVGATLVGNANAVTAHIPASRIYVERSHIVGCFACAQPDHPLPLNMRKTKMIGAVEKSIALDAHSYDYARCHGGFSNPRARYAQGTYDFIDKKGCDTAPPRKFEPVPEKF